MEFDFESNFGGEWNGIEVLKPFVQMGRNWGSKDGEKKSANFRKWRVDRHVAIAKMTFRSRRRPAEVCGGHCLPFVL